MPGDVGSKGRGRAAEQFKGRPIFNPILPEQIFWCFCPGGPLWPPLFISVSVTPMLLDLSRMVPTAIKKTIKQCRS